MQVRFLLGSQEVLLHPFSFSIVVLVAKRKKNSPNKKINRAIVMLCLIAAVGAGAYSLSPLSVSSRDPKWPQPRVVYGEQGIVRVTIDARRGRIGPTIEMRGGNTVRITSLGGDAVTLHGIKRDREGKLLKTQQPGLYWYEAKGIVGAIIVRGDIDEFAGVSGLPERTVVMTQGGSSRLVNGVYNPSVTMRPGEIQRWKILNAGEQVTFTLHGESFYIIARDGNTLSRPEKRTEEVLAPGDRVEILVVGPPARRYLNPNVTIVSKGLPVIGAKIPTELLPAENVTLFEPMATVSASLMTKISEQEFPNPIEPEYDLYGNEEEPEDIHPIVDWILTNDSADWRILRSNTHSFQVIEIEKKPVLRDGHDDTFPVAPHTTIKIRVKY